METVEVVRVKFRWPGKMYEFLNNHGLTLKRNETVVCETYQGGSLVGTVAIAPRIRIRREDDHQLSSVLRVATDQDLSLNAATNEFKSDVKKFFETRMRSRELSGVRMVDVEKADGGRKLIIYFASEQRKFDPRDLAAEMGQRFGVRIDLRPVGIRDAARLAGGIGKCGLSLCCSTWLPEFDPVSIKMAKDQGLSLDPESISGQCGRLLCCLGYEHQNYLEMGRGLPKIGKVVTTPLGDARVVKLDILKSMVTVRTEEGAYEVFSGNDVKRKYGPGQGQGSTQEDSENEGPAHELEDEGL